MSGPSPKNPEIGNVLLAGEAELDFCLRDHIRNVDQYQAGCEMSNDCQNCSCPGRISAVCGETRSREGESFICNLKSLMAVAVQTYHVQWKPHANLFITMGEHNIEAMSRKP